MTFLHPEMIYYLLPPLLILFGFLLTQKEYQAHFFSQDVMDKLRVSANTLTLKARNALFLLIGILIIIALAEPVIKDGTIQVKAKSADIMIALDISDSMLAHDVYPSRLESAKKKALTLLTDSKNERLGVVAFAKNSFLVSPLSFDSQAVAFLLSKLDTSSITKKGTDFLSMLEVVASTQSKSDKKYLLILSDGGDSKDFSKEIEFAKDNNIIVFVLGMGSEKGAPIKKKDGTYIKYNGDIIISKLNEKISSFATKTGGVYIENTISDKDIKAMFKEMENISDKKELKSQDIKKYIPLFYYPLGLALFILLIATSSMSKRVEVNVPNMLLIFLLAFSASDANAGLLDFMELDKAKKAYEAGDYKKSAKIYEEHARRTNNPYSYYNAGNSFYKNEKYKEAANLYEKAIFKDDNYRAKKLANLGNSHAKQKTIDHLEKAKKYYEQSLKIKEDKDIKDNLKEVEKELQKKKKQKKQNDNNKDSKDKKKSKDSKNSKDNKDNSNKKDSKDRKDNKDNSNKKDSKDSKNSKDNKNNKSKNSDKKDKDSKSDSKNKKDKQNIEKLNQDNNKSKINDSKINQMSDAELKKWINQLQTKQRTYLYQLNKPNKRQDENEKPW